jgi:predicted PurR-regulated permease PerM
MHLSFQNAFYVIATVIGLFAILILAKAVLIPIAFAFLLAFILFPVARKLESWLVNQMMSALISILGLLLIIGGGIYLFSNQIIQLSENLTDFKDKILAVFADATLFINKNIGFFPQLERGELLDKIKDWINESGGTMLSQTFSSTANILVGLLTTFIFTFLILIYRDGLVRAFVSFYPLENRENAFKMFKSIQQVGQRYLFGMMVIILILGFVNSIGLWIIGIDSPFLFGFLAGLLAIIPYAGTNIGAAITVLYAVMTYDSVWMPVTIAIFFWFVSIIESNFLSPRIVGGNLRVNVLASILSIIIGASIWGIAGMILFLPFAAMLKVVCENYEELKPIALLMGEHNSNPDDVKNKIIDKWSKKITNWFSRFRSNFQKNEQLMI